METVIIKSEEDVENIILNYETYLNSNKEFNINFLYQQWHILQLSQTPHNLPLFANLASPPSEVSL